MRDDVRAKLRTSIKRLLVKHGYPPDKQVETIKLVMEQMEQMEQMAPRRGGLMCTDAAGVNRDLAAASV